ncbi:hypothetical protein BVRB_6g136250 [Beta vulgaris subsp. vulgaris]|nr:hypothetical protein BVRB_6g136250 [Beta vulgaris subsp. vulgaris]
MAAAETFHVVLESNEEMNSHQTHQTADKKKKVPKPENALHKPMKHTKRQRRLTSNVWVHFEFLEEPNEHGNLVCKCKKCGQIYNADSSIGTGNLRRHLKNCKRRSYLDVGQMILDSSSSGSLLKRMPDVNLDVFREMLAIAVVRHDLPFQFAEYEGVRRCFAYLNPNVKVVSRNTLKADIQKLYVREKGKLKDELGLVRGRIALTSDCWSFITTDGYISLTAHFVDNDWRLQKRILNFRFMPPPHTGVHLSDHVCVAVVLDARFKYQFLEWAFKRIYGDVEGELELEKFKDRFHALYESYAAQSSVSPSRRRRSATVEADAASLNGVGDEFMNVSLFLNPTGDFLYT